MKKKYTYICVLAVGALALGGCEDSKSYSDLLTEEEHAVNWYLANQQVVPYVPEDSVFLVGESAPFYKMDEDGFVYMQVINRGDMDNRPQKGDKIYFRYKARNIKEIYNGTNPAWFGNADDLDKTSTSLIYGNNVIESTTSWGEGIQVPLEYVGYNSEVNLIIKSPMGIVSGQSLCLPYIYNIKYFKAEY